MFCFHEYRLSDEQEVARSQEMGGENGNTSKRLVIVTVVPTVRAWDF